MTDDGLLHVLEVLAAMPPARRNARLMLLDFLSSLPKEELALLAITVQPHLIDEEVAGLCGVSLRTLYNWKRYQAWKLRVADYLESKKRHWYMPDDPAA